MKYEAEFEVHRVDESAPPSEELDAAVTAAIVSAGIEGCEIDEATFKLRRLEENPEAAAELKKVKSHVRLIRDVLAGNPHVSLLVAEAPFETSADWAIHICNIILKEG
jgi:hypothetical protein